MGEQPKVTTKKEEGDVDQNQENPTVKEDDRKDPETKGPNKPRLGKNCLSFTAEMRAAI